MFIPSKVFRKVSVLSYICVGLWSSSGLEFYVFKEGFSD